MENPASPSPTSSPTVPIDDPFPSVVIPSRQGALDDDGRYGIDVVKPEFVIADDKNFTGG